MIKITPRFFVLPLIALAVIASLPRPAAQVTQGCLAQATPASSIVRADLDKATCAAAPQQVVLASQQAMVR